MSKFKNQPFQNPPSGELKSVDISVNIGRKIYIPCKLSFKDSIFKQASGMYDTGADTCIMRFSYFSRLFSEHNKQDLLSLIKESNYEVSGITNRKIDVIGSVYMSMFLQGGPVLSIEFLIVDQFDQFPSESPFIIASRMQTLFGLILMPSSLENTIKVIQRNKYGNRVITSSYATELELNTAYGVVEKISSMQTVKVDFVISKASKYLVEDKVIVSQDKVPYDEMDGLRIITTVTKIHYKEYQYVVNALVENLSNKTFSGVIKATIDLFDKQYRLYPIKDNSKHIKRSMRRLKTDKVSIMSECRLPDDKEVSVKNIVIKKPLIFNDSKIKSKCYKVDISFPNHSPDLSDYTAVNNNVNDPNVSLTDERYPIKEKVIPNYDLKNYYDSEQSVQMGFQPNWNDIKEKDLQPEGIGIPISILDTPKDIIKESNYDPKIWPYVKNIFIDKYPQIVSRHSLDRGHLSKTLGYFNLRLKENIVLPKNKKIIYESSADASMLRDVLDYLCKLKVISKASLTGDDIPNFSSPCFLVKRSSKDSAARLVVSYKLLNECISQDPITISNFDMILNRLHSAHCYSSIDLKSAFQSIELTPESKKLTLFSCMWGSYIFNTLATGMSVSPNALARFCDVMIHHIPSRDKNGKIQLNEKGLPIMINDRIPNVEIFYDDIIIFSKAGRTYEETIKIHFDLVEKVVSRLAFHRAKLEVAKSQLCKFKISFLGWLISNNYLMVDPRRVEKLNEKTFPSSAKGMKSFLGEVNWLRNTLNFQVLRNIHYLTPLTSTKLGKYNPNNIHREKFEELKKQLTQSCLFSKICLPGVPKILFTDAASEKYSQYSCVLAQIVPAKYSKNFVPSYIYLDDPTHRIIFDLKLPVKPVPLKKDNQTIKDYLINLESNYPPEYEYLDDDTLGYQEHFKISLSVCLKLMLELQNCVTKFESICFDLQKHIREHIMYNHILDTEHKGNKLSMKLYLEDIKKGVLKIDTGLHIFSALSNVLHRPVTLINATNKFNGKKLIRFNNDKNKPPFFFLLYEKNSNLIVRPTILNKHSEYNIGKHKGSFEIILYHSKVIPEEMRKTNIMQLELYAILGSLQATRKMVNSDELLLACDNKCLYYLYNQDVKDSHTKINNWGVKIEHDYPNLGLVFIKSENNPADFLSRVFQVSKPEIAHIKLPYIVKDSLNDYMPNQTTMTVKDWRVWVENNPQFIEVDKTKLTERQLESINKRDKNIAKGKEKGKEIKSNSFQVTWKINNSKVIEDIIINELDPKVFGSALSNNLAERNTRAVFNPIRVLEDILTTDKIIEEQQKQYTQIYTNCVTSKDKTYKDKNTFYFLQLGILYIKFINKIPRIYVPDSLLDKYIAMVHTIVNHGGPKKMISNLINYYNPNLQKLCYKYASICVACMLTNHPNRSNKLGVFPLTAGVLECIHMDLIEGLPTASGFNHILMARCVISGYMILLPVVTKTANEFLYLFVNHIWVHFHPKAVFSDNAGLFSSNKTIRILALLGCQFIYSSSFSGMSHGAAESYVGLVKRIMKKVLSNQPNFNWTFLPSIIAQLHNSSRITKTGFTPNQLVFGTESHLSKCFLDNPLVPKFHPIISRSVKTFEAQQLSLTKNLDSVRHFITKERDNRLDKANRNKVTRSFQVGDVIFVKDMSKILGTTQPLKTYYHPQPFVIVKVNPVSAWISRIVDELTIIRPFNHFKKYIPFSDEFKDLPKEIKEIAQQQPINLTTEEIKKLISSAPLNFELFKNDEKLDKLTIDSINEFDKPKPENLISDSEIKDQILNDDIDETSMPITRSKLQGIIKQKQKDHEKSGETPKQITFDLHTDEQKV